MLHDIEIGLGIFVFLIFIFVIYGAYRAKKVYNEYKIKELTISQKDDADTDLIRSKSFVFIVNPSKPDAHQVVEEIKNYFSENKLTEPKIVMTEKTSPGGDQAYQAAIDGNNIVVACGGDGTVRQVACGITRANNDFKKSCIMGIIPIGTGNIFARNLGLPLDGIRTSLRTVVYGKKVRVDLGWASRSEDPDHIHAFTVIAGVGVDANMVKNSNDKVKNRVGPIAYFASGASAIFGKRVKAKITIFKGETASTYKVSLKSIMVGNCGEIPGFTLIPDAQYDDGLLDVVAIDTRAGIIGWSQLALEVFLQKFGVVVKGKHKIGRIEQISAQKVILEFDKKQTMHLDGDIVAETIGMTLWLDQSKLTVKVP